jgi:hypothetical protein
MMLTPCRQAGRGRGRRSLCYERSRLACLLSSAAASAAVLQGQASVCLLAVMTTRRKLEGVWLEAALPRPKATTATQDGTGLRHLPWHQERDRRAALGWPCLPAAPA